MTFIKGRDHLGDLDVDGDNKWILEEWDVRTWTGFIWLTTGTSRGLL
jgi:hypothetical protein